MGRVTLIARKGPQSGTVGARIAETVDRLGLNENQAAAYLGVPLSTYRKWINGDRNPNAVVVKLLDVLGAIEALSPRLHDGLIPD